MYGCGIEPNDAPNRHVQVSGCIGEIFCQIREIEIGCWVSTRDTRA